MRIHIDILYYIYTQKIKCLIESFKLHFEFEELRKKGRVMENGKFHVKVSGIIAGCGSTFHDFAQDFIFLKMVRDRFYLFITQKCC